MKYTSSDHLDMSAIGINNHYLEIGEHQIPQLELSGNIIEE